MFQRYPNLFIGLLFFAAVVIGGQLGNRIQNLREAEAFYRWVMAAAVNDNLFKNANTEFKDLALYDQVRQAGEALLPEPENTDGAQGAKLTLVAREGANDGAVFQMARDPALAPARRQFLQYARANELEFAKNVQYAQASASGVNIFNLFFGFRKVAANFVWLQVDRFWHQGMMHRMIPLMKTCVLLDPQFTDAYLLGAWHLAYNVTAKMPETPEALKQWHPGFKACVGEKETYYYIAADFLKDGVRNNPRDYKLYFDLGFSVYSEKLNDYPNAVKYLSEAVRQPHERWVPRMLFKALESNKQYAEAIAGWEDYIERFPDTTGATDTAPRSIQRLQALDAEQRANQLFAEADALAATDAAQADAKRAEATSLREQARKTYRLIGDQFALGRLGMIDADELAAQGRYIEAIALLDRARWDNPNDEFFEDASNRIIEIKQRGNVPLTLSERKAVVRMQDGERCIGQPEDTAPASGS